MFQIIINFTSAAFSRSFWNGENGLEKQLKTCEEKDDGKCDINKVI